MSILRDRIGTVGTLSPNLRVVGTNNGPTEIPLSRIQIYPGVVAYETLDYLITADGAPVPASSPGNWGQLYAAGQQRRA